MNLVVNPTRYYTTWWRNSIQCPFKGPTSKTPASSDGGRCSGQLIEDVVSCDVNLLHVRALFQTWAQYEDGTLRDTILHSSEYTALSVAGVQYKAPV